MPTDDCHRPVGRLTLTAEADEAGTAPGDRRFRPDIQALRAVAVVLVVLYHAGLTGLGGGYVGVDVFFVISGFVITGVLLRERPLGRSMSLASSMVGAAGASSPPRRSSSWSPWSSRTPSSASWAATKRRVDGRWTAVFLANFHFSSLGTNYLTARATVTVAELLVLAVEEQFYIVYPAIFLVLVGLPVRLAQRLVSVSAWFIVVASYALSVVQTASDPTVAYFSPLTRAWELALGALLAVATPWLLSSHAGSAPS